MEGEGRTRITADAEVRKRAVVTTPNPPIKTDRDCRVVIITARTVGVNKYCWGQGKFWDMLGGRGGLEKEGLINRLKTI